MYALCVSGAVNTQGFVRIFFNFFYALYINCHSFIHSSDRPDITVPVDWA